MRALRSAGKIVRGIEISDVTKTSCKELAKEGVVETGVLNDLSRFEDKRFDVVFSSEVLEHVPTHLAEQSVKELVRIAKKDVFVTISLRRSGLDPKDPKKPAIVHLTVWPREKWEKAFQKAGCDVNRDALCKRLGLRPCSSLKTDAPSLDAPGVVHQVEQRLDQLREAHAFYARALDPELLARQRSTLSTDASVAWADEAASREARIAAPAAAGERASPRAVGAAHRTATRACCAATGFLAKPARRSDGDGFFDQ